MAILYNSSISYNEPSIGYVGTIVLNIQRSFSSDNNRRFVTEPICLCGQH